MAARIVTFMVWGLVAASAVFWGLRAGGAGPAAPAHATAAPLFTPLQADLGRVLGGQGAVAVPPSASLAAGAAVRTGLDPSRLKLLGVVTAAPQRPAHASATSRDHLALIALDGKPARTFRTGAAVEGEMVVQAIEARRVHIGPRGGEPALTLELPAGGGSTSGVSGGASGTETARTGRFFGNTPQPTSASSSSAATPPTGGGGADAVEESSNEAEGEADPATRPPRRTEPTVLRTPSPLTR